MELTYSRRPPGEGALTLIGSGRLCASFDPATGECGGVIGYAPEGARFEMEPVWTDFGADIDNMPPNTAALRRLTGVKVRLWGRFRGLIAEEARARCGGTPGPVPRGGLWAAPVDLWLVGDMGPEDGGFMAICLKKALPDLFSVELRYQDTGLCELKISGGYALDDPDGPPCEIWVGRAAEAQSSEADLLAPETASGRQTPSPVSRARS